MNKTDEDTLNEANFEEDFFESIPDKENFLETLKNKEDIKKIQECLENLPKKQREALKNAFENNEKLNDSERKNKRRGLDKIREMMTNTVH